MMTKKTQVLIIIGIIYFVAGAWLSHWLTKNMMEQTTLTFATYRDPVTETILKHEVDRLYWKNEDLQATVDSQQWIIAELKEQLEAFKRVELTTEEFELVCRVVAAEARGESYKGQQGVAQVIRDRYLSGYYGDSVSDVVYAPYQFAEPWMGNLDDYPSVREAVEAVFSGKDVFNGTAIYFFNPTTSNQNAVNMLREGSTYFGVIGRHEFRGWTNE